jgi:hypothetical protein
LLIGHLRPRVLLRALRPSSDYARIVWPIGRRTGRAQLALLARAGCMAVRPEFQRAPTNACARCYSCGARIAGTCGLGFPPRGESSRPGANQARLRPMFR